VDHTPTRFRRGQGEQVSLPPVSTGTPVGETVAQVVFSSLMQKPFVSIGPLQICRHKPLWKRIVSKTVDYQNNTRMDTASSEPAITAFSVPPFTPREVHERLGDVLNENTMGTVYSLEGYPSLAVQEILLDGLDKGDLDAIKTRLTVILTLSHPGVLKHHQVVEDEGLIYVVTDRQDKTLERLLAEHKRRKIFVPIAVILSVMKQVAAALAYLHGLSGVGANGLVHCDLRPANVLISADGERFIVADFGLCRNTLWSESTIAGMAVYMAPEVLLHNEASPASDVWSLGAILYELTTLRRLDFLKGKEPAEVFVDGWKPNLSGITDGFIKSILERIFVLEPERRLTARELHDTLTAADIPVGELGAQYAMLRYECGSLKAALNNAKARIATLEAALDARSAEMVSQSTETASLKDALENQGKEHLAMIKALENRFTQSNSEMNRADSQINLSALPRLIRAAHTNDMETVQMLANKRNYIGQRDEQEMTALMHAAQQGHVGPVELLVRKERGLKDKSGWTALIHATHNNHPEVVKIIAPHEHGKRNKNGRTALMIAAQKGYAKVVSVLAPYEEDLTDRYNKTALILAAEARHEDVVEVLDPTDDRGVTALMRAVGRGDMATAKALVALQRGRVAHGETALMQAVTYDNINGIKLLLPHESGMHDRYGATALMKAAYKGYLEAVKLLIKKESGMKDNYNRTALMEAATRNHLEIVIMLIEYEACMRDSSGETALMKAASNGHLEVVELLIEYEAGKNDDSGETALIKAALGGYPKVVELLFESEGYLIDKSDKSFFGKLEAKGYFEIVSFLRDSSRTSSTDDYSYS
ncbi:Serine/threonine protein kinase, partial [Giardia duodenalis]